MKDDIELHILQMNFVEFLASFLEGRVTLLMIFQLNEDIYQRDGTTLSQAFSRATHKIHDLKERIDRGEKIDEETITYAIDDIVLELLDA